MKSNTAIDTNNPLIKLAMDLAGKTVRFFGSKFSVGKIVFEPGKNEGEKPSLLIQLFAGKEDSIKEETATPDHRDRPSGKSLMKEFFEHLAGEAAKSPPKEWAGSSSPQIEHVDLIDMIEKSPTHFHAVIKVRGREYGGCGKSRLEAMTKAVTASIEDLK